MSALGSMKKSLDCHFGGNKRSTRGRYNCMTFGNLPAAARLELARAGAGRLGRHVDGNTARQIRDKMYMDGGAIAAQTRKELEGLRGERRSDTTYTGKISQIMVTAGLKPKFISLPFTAIPKEVNLLGGKVLGLGTTFWQTSSGSDTRLKKHEKEGGGVLG